MQGIDADADQMTLWTWMLESRHQRDHLLANRFLRHRSKSRQSPPSHYSKVLTCDGFRFVTLRRGSFQGFDTRNDTHHNEKMKISHVEEHSIRNIFRNVCLVPKDPAHWVEAFEGQIPFTFNKPKKQAFPRGLRAMRPGRSRSGHVSSNFSWG